MVVGFTEKNIREHYEMIAILEAETCQIVIENESPLEGIEYCLLRERNILETHPEKYPDYNRFFHYEIWFASGNTKMLNMLSRLWDWLPLEYKTIRPEHFQNSHAEHENIFWKLLQRDISGAHEAMYSHIVRHMNNILTRCK